jgi:hypothetical protein
VWIAPVFDYQNISFSASCAERRAADLIQRIHPPGLSAGSERSSEHLGRLAHATGLLNAVGLSRIAQSAQILAICEYPAEYPRPGLSQRRDRFCRKRSRSEFPGKSRLLDPLLAVISRFRQHVDKLDSYRVVKVPRPLFVDREPAKKLGERYGRSKVTPIGSSRWQSLRTVAKSSPVPGTGR